MDAAPAARSARKRLRIVNVGDRTFVGFLTAMALFVLIVAGVILFALWRTAHPAAEKFGLSFISGTDWDPVAESFGALPFIYGTLVTSGVALFVAVPVAMGLALFVTEMAPTQARALVSFGLELLAGIPSVVYGLWGIFVMVPWLRDSLEPFLGRTLGVLPLFRGTPIGMGYLAGGLILAVMILPTITSISIEVIRTVPLAQREAALALGATRWEMVRLSVIPYCRAGIVGAILLGLGRALGETMAVTMVIGNNPEIHASLFAAGYTLPSVIANEFAEASGAMHTAALALLALLLFGVTLILNVAARLLVRAVRRGPARLAAP